MKLDQVLRESWRRVSRNRGQFLLAAAVQAICLTLLSIFVVMTINVTGLIRSAGKRVEIYAFLDERADAETIRSRIALLTGVSGARYVTKEEALEELRADLGPDTGLVSTLGENPLPPSIRVNIAGGLSTADVVGDIEKKVELIPGVTEVWSGREFLARLDAVMRTVFALDALILVIVCCSVAFIVFQTVEASINAHRSEIEIMELVGAPRSAVRLPFVIEGAVQGLIGGVASFALVYALYRILRTTLSAPVFPTSTVVALDLGLGALLGLLGAVIALSAVQPRHAVRTAHRRRQ
jgi:cell division transport system permease protein